MKTTFHASLLAIFPSGRLCILPAGRPSGFPSVLCVVWPSFRNALWERGMRFIRNCVWRLASYQPSQPPKPADLNARQLQARCRSFMKAFFLAGLPVARLAGKPFCFLAGNLESMISGSPTFIHGDCHAEWINRMGKFAVAKSGGRKALLGICTSIILAGCLSGFHSFRLAGFHSGRCLRPMGRDGTSHRLSEA